MMCSSSEDSPAVTWGCSAPWLRPLLGLLLVYKSLIQMILPFFTLF